MGMSRSAFVLLLFAVVSVLVYGNKQYREQSSTSTTHTTSSQYSYGFMIHHRQFTYKGHEYKLTCGKTRFLTLWRRYYQQFNSRRLCIQKLLHNKYILDQSASKVNYFEFFKRHNAFSLEGNRFLYKGNVYFLKCGVDRFYQLWYQYFQQYRSITQLFGVMYRNHIFVRISYAIYYQKHGGFPLQGKLFTFNGKTYVLSCARGKFYKLWYQYYQQYQHTTKVFNELQHKQLVKEINYVNFYKTHHGFPLKGKSFVYNGHAYILRCGISRYFQLWHTYFNRYGSALKIFKHMYHKKVFVKINYATYYRSHQGFKLKGKRFVYNGITYVLRCGLVRFYHMWYRYYEQYGSCVTRVFKMMYKKQLFSKINFVNYYKTHEGFKLEGKLFFYDGKHYALRCARKVFYRSWFYYYERYQSITKVFRVMYEKKMFSSINYVSFYNKNHGFKLKGKTFVYRKHTFIVKCGISKFYRIWYRYYQRYRSVSKIFEVMSQSRVFVRIDYAVYYKKHGGFIVENNKKFVYDGKSYILRCDLYKFYRLWFQYYEQYQCVKKIFGVLYQNGLIVNLNYVTFYKTHHGFSIKGKLVVYERKSYEIRCSRKRYYRLWYRYYNRYHDVNKIFKLFYRKKIIAQINYVNFYRSHSGFVLKGKSFEYKGHRYFLKCGLKRFYLIWHQYYLQYKSLSKIFKVLHQKKVFQKLNYLKYYKSHGGLSLEGKRFVYKGSAYVLRCKLTRFYRLWYRFYEQYQCASKIFKVMLKNGIFVKLNYATFYKTHKGFILKSKIFDYNGKTYALKCGRNRFYRLWYLYYQQYRSTAKIFKVLSQKQVFVRINYVQFFKTHRGFEMKGNTFVFKGQTFIVKCGLKRFYRFWHRYYIRYESVTKIFHTMLSKRVFVRINYASYYKRHQGPILNGKYFVYSEKAYVLRCELNKFYRLWYEYYEQYQSVTKMFTTLRRNGIVVEVDYAAFYQSNNGFKLKGKIFTFERKYFVLKCGRHRLYRLWYRYYRQYKRVKEVFSVLYQKQIFSEINNVNYYNTHRGFKLKGKTFVFKDHTYYLRCGISKFYDLWQRYYYQYESVTKIFRIFSQKRVFVRIDYVKYYRKHQGFILKNKQFVYNGKAYIIRCGLTKFYRLWYRYYEQYQCINKIFGVLFKNGIFTAVNYVSFYKTHQGFPLQGKIFEYNRKTYVIQCTRTRFYEYWYLYYQQYRSISKVFRVMIHKKMFSEINYAHYYKTHHGFELVGKTFSFKGHEYILKCGIKTFYRLWHSYYARYGKLDKIFAVFYQKRTFVKMNYVTYYKRHGGFILTGKRFEYHGQAYVLGCEVHKFYRLWFRYYEKYHCVSKLFRLLSRNGFIVKINYVTYFQAHGGLKLKGKIFMFEQKSYVLKCSRRKFYRLWYRYYQQYDSATKVFTVLFEKKIFVEVSYADFYKTHHGFSLKGKTFRYDGQVYYLRCGIGSFYQLWQRYYFQYERITKIFQVLYQKRVFVRINYETYYKKHNGFILQGKRFVYNGRAYILRCEFARFYRLWYKYFEQYHCISKIFKVLYKNEIFAKVNYVTFYKTHLGFTLSGKVFDYDSRAYALKCTRNKFYRLWYQYYQQYRHVSKIFKALYHKKIITRINYVSYYTSHHGFKLKGNTFVYKGQTYSVRCGMKKYYRLWYRYYIQYQSISKVFTAFYKKKVIVRFDYAAYYHGHRGFILTGNQFVYNQRDYSLKCGLDRFYQLWFQYYEQYQCITKIFTELHRNGIVKKINYVNFYKTHKGFSLKGKILDIRGKTYVLKCGRHKFYRSWYIYYRQYRSTTKIFKLMYRRKMFVTLNYADFYNANSGFALKGKTFVYQGHMYYIKCGITKFYNLWFTYYQKYDSVSKIFEVLYQTQAVVRMSYVTYYRKHQGFILTGKRFIYNGQAHVIKCGLEKFYRLWFVNYERYQNIAKIYRELSNMDTFIKVDYVSYYKTHSGFALKGKVFFYDGRIYMLKCTRHRLYRMWYRYYEKYQSVTKIFSELTRKKVFSRINFVTYYRNHLGLSLKGNTFNYNGHAYILKCGVKKFYKLWHKYYLQYDSVSKIFEVLYQKRIFVRMDYGTYYRKHHGFIITGKSFYFNGKSYVLSCGLSRFYRLWYRYYERYQCISKIFTKMYSKQLFAEINYVKYYKTHQGLQIRRKLFVYDGKPYVLKCSYSRLYRLWFRFYEEYRSVTKVFTELFNKSVFVAFDYQTFYKKHLGFSLKDGKFEFEGNIYALKCTTGQFYQLWYQNYIRYQSVARIVRVLSSQNIVVKVKSEINYAEYYKTHQGLALEGNRFVYDKNPYLIKCDRNRFYRLWYRYYQKYHSFIKVFNAMYRRHLFVKFDYFAYYKNHHGFALNGKDFTFNGKAYTLTLRRSKFFRVWCRYFVRYHNVDKVFKRLYERKLIKHRNEVSSQISYSTYYKTHQGLALDGKRFVFNGNAYILTISRHKFYQMWYQYFRQFRDVTKTIDALYNKRCFSNYDGGKRDQESTYSGESDVKQDSVQTDLSQGGVKTGRYVKRYHSFTIRNNRFSYKGKAYKLRCTPQNWFIKWGACYKEMDNIGSCLNKLQQQGLIIQDSSSARYDDIEEGEKPAPGNENREYQ